MNDSILNIENQEFININIDSDITQLILKGSPNTSATIKELVAQIEAKKRCKKKLSTWFLAQNIYFPNKLNIEQTSSEITAKYKSDLISGDSIIDLTGGFGVDCYYFSKHFQQVTHCEINTELSQIVKHNYKQLHIDNINCHATSGITFLEQTKEQFSWIYIDPSRRDNRKNKVFLLKDCLPNVPEYLPLLFERSNNIMIKTSPLLDISSGISELKHVKTIHCIAVNNDVKELLWVLEKEYIGTITLKTVNLKKDNKQLFNFNLKEESSTEAHYSLPLTYLYEPNSAILKSGAFNILATKLAIAKLQKHSHLYTSEHLIDFPGRRFKIIKVLDYNKKKFKKEFTEKKANITTRNFPESVDSIRKKLALKDGGNDYLFFTTNSYLKRIVIITEKI